ncbi:histidine phosphatase family protein [Streptococcus sp. sy018]|uniref:histidine phosphatase family protein n=1 Tax=Streptococcus sp. sy018 TaxID=2600147 RepID=UPI0011B7F814|nr:histidine phosphatase family protein [Streptococcus sp. sy018]TWS94195.1 histidine phosphatase family protein [Streptococcus sp. sy018]
MKIYFVRHGQTIWNRQGIFQGTSLNPSLLEDGKEDIIALGQHLRAIDFDAIFSSDLTRALETAQLINQENHQPKSIEISPQLREWGLGNLEGKKISLMQAIYPRQIYAFTHNLSCFNNDIFDAESVYQVTQRIANFVTQLDPEKYDTVLIVGHGASLAAGIGHLLGYSTAQLRRHGRLDNASLTILESQDMVNFQLLSWNDTSHFQVKEELALTN